MLVLEIYSQKQKQKTQYTHFASICAPPRMGTGEGCHHKATIHPKLATVEL